MVVITAHTAEIWDTLDERHTLHDIDASPYTTIEMKRLLRHTLHYIHKYALSFIRLMSCCERDILHISITRCRQHYLIYRHTEMVTRHYMHIAFMLPYAAATAFTVFMIARRFVIQITMRRYETLLARDTLDDAACLHRHYANILVYATAAAASRRHTAVTPLNR